MRLRAVLLLVIAVFAVSIVWGLGGSPAAAQLGGLVPDRPSVEEPRRLDELPQEQPAPGLRMPALPPPPPPPTEKRLSSQLKVAVKRIELTGNTVFSDEELAEVIAPYQGRVLSAEDLQSLRYALTHYYINHGFINSGAVIPDQEIDDGVLEVHLVEGKLTEIALEGNEKLRDSYITNRLILGSENTLKLQQLQQRIQLLQQDRLVDRINAELRPGMRPGESILRVDIQESRPFDLGFSFNNWRSPSVGSLQGEVYATAYNLTGFGDHLGGRYEHSEGFDKGSAFLSFPLTARDTRLIAYFDHSEADVVEEPFNALGISSKTTSYGLRLSQPLYQTVRRQWLGALILEKRKSESSLLGTPFSFSPGARDGKTEVTVLRLLQQWVDRSPEQVLALRAIFNVGIDAFGATINSSALPDGQFFYWLGQFQWLRRLWDTNNQVLIRSDVQLSADPLLPIEKFAIGGARTVRGYRENLLVRDNGVVVSLEFRVPLFRLPLPGISKSAQDGRVYLAPFYDFGWSENTSTPTPDPKTLSSIGIGLRWDPHPHIRSQLYWGHALRTVTTGVEHDLQDEGIHFKLDFQIL